MRRRRASAVIGIGVTCACASAAAHGPQGSNDGPAWCGSQVAIADDGGILIWDGSAARRIALASRGPHVAWSPDCARLATVAGDRVSVVDVASGAATALGPLDPFTRVAEPDWRQAVIAWSPNGRRFVVSSGSDRTRGRDGLVMFEPATRTRRALPLPDGELVAFGWLDDDRLAVAIEMTGSTGGAQIVVASPTKVTRIGSPTYQRVAVARGVVIGERGGDVVRVDPTDGRETVVARGVSFLEGISADATAALYAMPTGLESVALAGGTPSVFGDDFGTGIVAAAHHGWSPDGRVLVAPRGSKLVASTRGKPRVAYSAGRSGGTLSGKARSISHASVSPDGTQVAFLVEIGLGPIPGRCDWAWKSRIDLVIVQTTGRPRPRIAGTVRIDEHCAVE